ncbi:MAG: cell envelope integrity protein CreD [Rhizobium sp.]|nr:cell envelope integrity protein CreD [Rhizobium sp.]MBX9455568.1 cell envelope integrity protein CreD [Rhizobium sp.]
MTNQDFEPGREAALPPRAPEADAERPGGFAAFMRTPGVKFVIIGILTLLLLIPTLLVWALVEERAQRATEVSARISAGWGGPQIVNGPYLAVPVTVMRTQTVNGQLTASQVTDWVLLMPEELKVDARLDTEARRLSIYSLPVYNAKLHFSGRFGTDLVQSLGIVDGRPELDRAFLVMGIADITGIRSNADMKIDGGAAQPFQPGMKGIKALRAGYTAYDASQTYAQDDTGINRPVSRDLIEKGFAFEMDLSLNGSTRFSLAPAGQTTTFAAAANWPDPGFEGLFLPETKTITQAGFEANWTVPYLARGIDKAVNSNVLPLGGNLMSVNLVEPVKFYQLVTRTLKYSIGFLSLVFFAVFIIELKGGRMVHWVQYVLTGLALIIFYILLLALAEHVGFALAYGMAAGATTLLIAAYVGSVTGNRRSGVSIAIVLAVTYGVMYLILREDEYALLAGAIISFATIAATMYFTRNVDWSGRRQPA